MKKYFSYDLSNPQPVAGELHRIVNGQIRLEHIPAEGTLEIQGYVEAKSATHLQANEFFCNYSRDTNYREANRIVWFSTTRNNNQVSCAYMACGSPVTADDMNEIGDFMRRTTDTLTETNDAFANLKNVVVNSNTNAARLITEHEQNVDAHSDIRDLINANNEQNLLAHASINRNVDTANANATAAVNSVAMHIADPTAHSDIRTELATLKDELGALDIDNIQKTINAAISAHNDDTDAHEFLQNLVDVESLNRSRADELLDNRIDGLSSAFEVLNGALDEILSAGLSGLGTALDAETAARIAGDNALNEKISGAMIFGGTSTIFPTNPVVGTFAIVGGLPYVFDGTNWIKLKGDTQEDVTPGGQSFIDTILSNRPHANYSALGKADFLTYVFGDTTPTAYTETGSISKTNFIDYVFGTSSAEIPLDTQAGNIIQDGWNQIYDAPDDVDTLVAGMMNDTDPIDTSDGWNDYLNELFNP